MPQFDFTKFSSQIFWFGLCFIVLYYCVSKIILPRIRNILSERKSAIKANIDESSELESQINEIQIKTDQIRKEASSRYQIKLENTAKNLAQEKEKAIESLKEKIETMTQKSNQEVKDFIAESHTKNTAVIQGLVKSIKDKIFA